MTARTPFSNLVPWLLLAALTLPALAYAYIEPWDFISKRIAETNRHWQGFKAEFTQTIQGDKPERHTLSLELKRPTDLLLERDGTIWARVKDGREDAAFKALPADLRSLLHLWLAQGDVTRMNQLLQDWEIPSDQTGLGRVDQTICYIVGGTEANMDRNQLWFEKWTFKPARIYKVNGQGFVTEDVRLRKTDGVITEGDVAERIEFHRNGTLAERWEVKTYRRATLNSTWLNP